VMKGVNRTTLQCVASWLCVVGAWAILSTRRGHVTKACASPTWGPFLPPLTFWLPRALKGGLTLGPERGEVAASVLLAVVMLSQGHVGKPIPSPSIKRAVNICDTTP
jgi:hypothetical protein